MIIEEKQVATSEALSESEDELENVVDARSRSKSLIEFRFRVEEAINGNYLFTSKADGEAEEARLWGVPLLPSQGHEGTDAVLNKFLKAKRYKVHEAFTALRKTLRWRADFRPADELAPPQDNVWFTSGADKEGRPLCYNVLGKEYQKNLVSLGDQSYQDYLRWRLLCVEEGIRHLNFRPGGVDSVVQILDMRHAGGPTTKEMKLIGKKMITLLHDHYPGIVHKNLIINVPSWFLTLNALNLRMLGKRSKNKFIFVKPSRVTETLLKYATIENILVQYGGLRRENDTEFTSEDKVLEAYIRANGTELIQIPVEAGVSLTWDITVIGYDVTYREEFVPDDECSYKILLQEKRMGESIRNSFYIREPGKIVISILNASYTRKKAFYRYKTRQSLPIYRIYN
ncbi:patellin-4-like [Salvia miltiorrhiza]|uniref:patellin-4-like n=1 Tax=Salvia miltiorrhiza TaxID=226208 RepID=UPI0025ABF7B5|nr:patellin-4-like [Salvia miltiorrhiza]